METTPGGADESVRSVVLSRLAFVFITVLFEYCLIKQKMHDKQNTALSSSYLDIFLGGNTMKVKRNPQTC